MWVLVFLNIMNSDAGYPEPTIEAWYEYETMTECFFARDKLAASLGSENGYYPINTQAICVLSDRY